MSGVLQGSWSIGFLLSSVIYGLFYDYYRLARHVVDRRAAGAVDRLHPLFRQGAARSGSRTGASSAPRSARFAPR